MVQKPKPQALVRKYVVCAIGIPELPRPEGIPELQEAQISPISESALKRRGHWKLERLGSDYRSRNLRWVRNLPAHFSNSLPGVSNATPMRLGCRQPSRMNS